MRLLRLEKEKEGFEDEFVHFVELRFLSSDF